MSFVRDAPNSRKALPACYPDAIDWLKDHLDGLMQAPTRLHDRETGDDGAPRLSQQFMAVLAGSPYATTWSRDERACPLSHPIGAPTCSMCADQLTYTVQSEVYRHPLAAALATLKHAPATSHDWPTPYQLVLTLLREGFDLDRAATAIGHPILGPDHRKTVEAAFLLAVRKLVGRWASGPIPRAPRWIELSEAQQNAENAA